MMGFMDAVSNMLAGKRLTRPAFTGFYIAILNNQSYMWSIPNSNAGDKPSVTAFTASVDDVLATDWMVKTN